jgi:hypothetical protein
VAQACNPSYSGSEDGEDHSLRPAQAKRSTPPSQPITGCSGMNQSFAATTESTNRRIPLQASLDIK